MGICRNFPRKLVFSTLDYMGLNIVHLHTLQEILRIKDIIFHNFNDTLTGKLYKTSMELFYIELGMNPQRQLPSIDILETLTTSSLVKSTMVFMVEYGIYFKHNITIPLLRSHDELIMESFLRMNIPLPELLACNKCRLFLKACTLSDIVTGDGNYISDQAWLGHLPVSPRRHNWPNLPKSSKAMWTIWQKWLLKTFTSRGRRLRNPLREWTTWDAEWQWYMTSDGYLYSLQNNTWYSHRPVLRRARLPTFEGEGIECPTPPQPLRATVYKKGSRLVCTGCARIVRQIISAPQTFDKYLKSIPTLSWCVSSINMLEDGKPLIEVITSGLTANILAVSDGSFKDNYGAAAWTIGTLELHDILHGKVVCPGAAKDQSAYRSELTGLYAMMTVLHHLCLFNGIEESYVELGCDGASALSTIFDRDPVLTTDIPDYDLVGAIYHLKKTSKVTWTHRHVKGHQDDIKAELDTWALRNILMESRAKSHLQVAKQAPRHHNIEGKPWQLWVQGEKLTKDIQGSIYSAVHNRELWQYWETKRDIDPDGLQMIDWPAIGKAMQALPRSRRVFISKHVSGMCGVGKFMKRWKEWDSDSCPRCGMVEDAAHVWQCKGPGTEELWTKALGEIEVLLVKLETDPTITFVIMSYLRSWRTGEGIVYDVPIYFQQLLHDQQLVGWGRFFEGWLVKDWSILQQRYYSITRSRRTGRRWTIAILKKLWDTAWDLWEHRNGILHDKENLITRSMIINLNARVSRVYTELSSRALRHYDRHLVYLPLTTLIRKDTNYKVTWLSVAEPALGINRQEEWRRRSRTDRMLQGMQRNMFSWLKT